MKFSHFVRQHIPDYVLSKEEALADIASYLPAMCGVEQETPSKEYPKLICKYCLTVTNNCHKQKLCIKLVAHNQVDIIGKHMVLQLHIQKSSRNKTLLYLTRSSVYFWQAE